MPRRSIVAAVRAVVVRAYFAASYRALASPAGREFLARAAAPGAPAAHGYTTAEDIEGLLAALRPSPTDLVLDLGCGFGEVALALTRATGCRVLGVDGAPRAVAAARRRAAEAGLGEAVRFRVGRLEALSVQGSAAYALDTLMFLGHGSDMWAAVARTVKPGGRLFATLIDSGARDGDGLARSITAAGLALEGMEDVTAAFAAQSRRRSVAARQIYRARPRRAGRFGLLLFLAEEAAVSWLVERGRLHRWRLAMSAPASPVSQDGPR